jgi:hypothetical protein
VALAGEVGDQVAIGAALVVIETDAVEGESDAEPRRWTKPRGPRTARRSPTT